MKRREVIPRVDKIILSTFVPFSLAGTHLRLLRTLAHLLYRCSFFLNLEPVPDLELVKPAFRRNEILTCGHLNGHLLDFAGSNGPAFPDLLPVPLIQLPFHLGVFGFAAAALFALAADLDPPLERLQRHLIVQRRISGAFLRSQRHRFPLQVGCEHAVLLAGRLLRWWLRVLLQIGRELSDCIRVFLLQFGFDGLLGFWHWGLRRR